MRTIVILSSWHLQNQFLINIVVFNEQRAAKKLDVYLLFVFNNQVHCALECNNAVLFHFKCRIVTLENKFQIRLLRVRSFIFF